MSKSDQGSPAAVSDSAQSQHGVTKLLALNVNDHVEKKNGLSYLSWAWAWAEALKADPAAVFHVESFQDAQGVTMPYMKVGETAMVWVRVDMLGQSRTCMLPVMDHRNKPITNPDAFAVNTAIMRCMTKCLALFGLGLYIYAGEDLPEETKQEASVEERKTLEVFADGILEYLSLQKDKKGLISYWNANKTRLDRLNETMPDRYEAVKAAFTQARKKFEEQSNGV